ncbi:hypothetical protein B9G98_04643 [Wickerhamiella sorbophila]|uniref:Protein PAL1 n=1 Tax=Wickerhamiella sorbophila TaxID=45607 RepID=A0A2T0FPV0_9ASCO|nr:hypothetical protein B9G98_04643 [Wickerhamiella sorbophila]PRT57023.1 hypothetical protein B9G98_04643 [Wickerhamiella sorbophila]
MSGNEPVRRGGTPISANNPFRQSMLLRSESPFESDAVYSQPQAAGSSTSVSSSSRGQTSGRLTPPGAPRRVSSNPFEAEQDSAAPSRGVAPPPPSVSRNDLPPPYDDRRRANSDSSAMDENEKDRLARRYEQESRRDPNKRGDYRDRDRERERRYREERNRLRAERDRLRAERDHLRAERSRLKDGKSTGGSGSGSRSSNHHHSSSSSARRNRTRSKSESHKSKTQDGPSLDVIDKLDVTGLFGPGSFHHDGPFDACTPHRNRDAEQGPVAAFPANGPNNSLAVEAPEVSRYKQEQVVFGRDPDVDPVFPEPTESFDPTARTKPVHGTTTLGLGSTTFVDGTPASAKAIEDADHDEQIASSMGRTRSLLRRQNPRKNSGSEGRQAELSARSSNPDRPTSYLHDDEKPSGLLGRVKSLRISRR